VSLTELRRHSGELLIAAEEFRNAGAMEVPAKPKRGSQKPAGPDLFSHIDL
jgi:hypothetical protein